MDDDSSNGYDLNCKVAQFWDQYQEDMKRTMEQVNQMYSVVSRVHGDTKHLVQLPAISRALGENVEVLQDIRDNLVGKATQQDPRLIKVFFICFFIIGCSMIALTAYFTKLNMEISKDGMKFQGSSTHESGN